MGIVHDLTAMRDVHRQVKKALSPLTKRLGIDVTIGYLVTLILRMHTDRGRSPRRALVAMAGALAGQPERVSLEDMELFRQVFLAIRNNDQEALAALVEEHEDVAPPGIFEAIAESDDLHVKA